MFHEFLLTMFLSLFGIYNWIVEKFNYYNDRKIEILNAYLKTIKMLYDNGKINGNNKKIYNKYTNSSLSTKRYYYENRTGPVSADLFYKCIKNNYHITYGEGSVPKFIAKLIL